MSNRQSRRCFRSFFEHLAFCLLRRWWQTLSRTARRLLASRPGKFLRNRRPRDPHPFPTRQPFRLSLSPASAPRRHAFQSEITPSHLGFRHRISVVHHRFRSSRSALYSTSGAPSPRFEAQEPETQAASPRPPKPGRATRSSQRAAATVDRVPHMSAYNHHAAAAGPAAPHLAPQ